MIVIVEGIDRVGKTTLCKMFQQKGFLYFKDGWNITPLTSQVNGTIMKKDFSLGKLDTTLSLLKELDRQGYDIVVDRMHLTEVVYNTLANERGVNYSMICKLDITLAAYFGDNVTLITVLPEDIMKSCDEAMHDLRPHLSMFDMMHETSAIKSKLQCKFSTLQWAVEKVMPKAKPYDFYFASPFFKPDQVEREEALKAQLRGLGYRIYSPKEECFLPSDATAVDRNKVFEDNCKAIRSSVAVFAVSDGKDMGTIWEAGYAYGRRIPVVYFAETLGDGVFNLMLAESGTCVFTDRSQLTYEAVHQAVYGEKTRYEGYIE